MPQRDRKNSMKSSFIHRSLRSALVAAQILLFPLLLVTSKRTIAGNLPDRDPIYLPSADIRQAASQTLEGGPSASLDHAQSLAQAGSFMEAEIAVRQCLAQNDSSAEAHFLLGYILFKTAKPKDSLAEYTAGAKFKNPGAPELKVVALDYVLLEDYPDAEHWLKASIARNALDVESWYYLGRAQYNENHFADAQQSFEHCLSLDSHHVKAETNLGLVFEALRRTEEARAAYLLAISWQQASSSKTAEPYIDLGNLLLGQNQNEQAVTYLLQAVQVSPDEVRARERLGNAYFRLNDWKNAQLHLEKAETLAPNLAAIHYVLGQVYRKQGLTEKAHHEFVRATELNAAHPVAPELVPH